MSQKQIFGCFTIAA